MAWPYILDDLPAGLQPLSAIDANFARTVLQYDSIAALLAETIIPSDKQPVLVLGSATAFDGGQVGIYAWYAADTTAADGIYILKLTSITTGRYRKIL